VHLIRANICLKNNTSVVINVNKITTQYLYKQVSTETRMN